MTEVTPEATASIEDLFLTVFCMIDDLYNAPVPESVRQRSQHHRLEMSDSEVLTLSVMQEALSLDSEASFLRFVRRNYLHLFPRLLARDRYNRRRSARRSALTEVHLLLFRHMARFFKGRAQYLIVDSAPIETAAFVRSQSAAVSMPEAAYGYLPSKKRHFFGFRLHGLISNEGAVVDFVLSPANVDERTVAQVLLQPYKGCAVLGDNGYSDGYAGSAMQITAARQGYALWVSPRQSQAPKTASEATWRRWLRAKRELIETVFAVLSDQFRMETTRALSLLGLKTRVAAKLLAFNMSLYLNHLLGRDLLSVKSLYL